MHRKQSHADEGAVPPGEQTPLLGGDSTEVSPRIARRLYVSHFLSTWNSRVFEFGAVLYLAKIYPGTLLPMSVYALTRGLSAMVFAPAVGRYIDGNDRLRVVRASISTLRPLPPRRDSDICPPSIPTAGGGSFLCALLRVVYRPSPPGWCRARGGTGACLAARLRREAQRHDKPGFS